MTDSLPTPEEAIAIGDRIFGAANPGAEDKRPAVAGAAHTCKTLTDGCYRCDLNRDEIAHAKREARIEADALREMAKDFRHIGMTEAAELCDEKAHAVEEYGCAIL